MGDAIVAGWLFQEDSVMYVIISEPNQITLHLGTANTMILPGQSDPSSGTSN